MARDSIWFIFTFSLNAKYCVGMFLYFFFKISQLNVCKRVRNIKNTGFGIVLWILRCCKNHCIRAHSTTTSKSNPLLPLLSTHTGWHQSSRHFWIVCRDSREFRVTKTIGNVTNSGKNFRVKCCSQFCAHRLNALNYLSDTKQRALF